MNGVNIKRPLEDGVAPWYKAGTLFEAIDNVPVLEKHYFPFLRIPLYDRFKDKGAINVYGKVSSGIIKQGMQCRLLPTLKTVTVTQVLDIDDKPMLYAS